MAWFDDDHQQAAEDSQIVGRNERHGKRSLGQIQKGSSSVFEEQPTPKIYIPSEPDQMRLESPPFARVRSCKGDDLWFGIKILQELLASFCHFQMVGCMPQTGFMMPPPKRAV